MTSKNGDVCDALNSISLKIQNTQWDDFVYLPINEWLISKGFSWRYIDHSQKECLGMEQKQKQHKTALFWVDTWGSQTLGHAFCTQLTLLGWVNHQANVQSIIIWPYQENPPTVDGRNSAPVDRYSLSHDIQSFIHTMWLAGFLPSTVCAGIRRWENPSRTSRRIKAPTGGPPPTYPTQK